MCWLRGDCPHTHEEYWWFCRQRRYGGWSNGRCPMSLRTPETVAAVRADFLWLTIPNISTLYTSLRGIPELLPELVQRGSGLAVASNKISNRYREVGADLFHVDPFRCGFRSAPPESCSSPIRRWCGRFSPIRMRNPERCCTPGIRASIWIRPGQPVSGRSV